MKAETTGKLFFKIASQDKAAGFLANIMLLDRTARIIERREEVQTKVASITEQVLSKKDA